MRNSNLRVHIESHVYESYGVPYLISAPPQAESTLHFYRSGFSTLIKTIWCAVA